MPTSWKQVEADSRYQGATPEKKAVIRQRYFDKHLVKHPKYLNLDETGQAKFREGFLKPLDTVTPKDQGDVAATEQAKLKAGEKSPMQEWAGEYIREFAQMHPALTKGAEPSVAAAAGAVKGATFGLLDLPTPGEHKVAEGVGEFAGFVLPMTMSVKMAQSILKAGKVVLETTVGRATAEGTLAGIIFGVAEGNAHGLSYDEVVEKAGWEGLTWGVFGAAVGRFMDFLGERSAKKAMGKAKRLLQEQGATEQEADDMLMAIKKATVVAKDEGKVKVKVPKGKVVKGKAKVKKVAESKKAAAVEQAVKEIEKAPPPVKPSLTEPGLPVGPPKKKGAFLRKKPKLEEAVAAVKAEGKPAPVEEAGKEIVLKVKPPVGRLEAIRAAAERARAKKAEVALGETAKPKRRVVPEEEVDVPLPPNVQRARPEKGLPVIELTKAELQKEVVRSRQLGAIRSSEEEVLGLGLTLNAGIPMEEAVALLRVLRRKVGTRYRQGEDLGLFASALKGVLSPSHLAKYHINAKTLVQRNLELRTSFLRRFVNDFTRMRDRAAKGLGKDQKVQVAALLDKYDTVAEIPASLLVKLRPEVLKGFTGLRRMYNRIWDMHSRMPLPKGVNPAKRPKRIHAYLTRVFEDINKLPSHKKQQVIRSFAEESGLSYDLASRILMKKIPAEGFFGPLSKKRLKEVPEVGRIWDLDFLTDFYIKGAGRKLYLDQFLRDAEPLLKGIDEGSNVYSVMRGYIDRQRGLPSNMLEGAFMKHPWLMKFAYYEALRQYISKLGVRPTAALINLTQYPLFDGTVALGAAMRERSAGPLYNFGKAAAMALTKQGRAMAHRSGVVFVEGRGELPLFDIPGFWPKVARVTGVLFQGAERFNKTASYLRNYYEFQRVLPGLRKLHPSLLKDGKAIHEAARNHAIGGVGRTQFFADVGDKPSLLVGPVGSTLGRFKTFPIKSLEFISNLDKHEAVAFMGLMDVMGGPDAFPVLRQLRYQLETEYPDSKLTKALGGLQEYSFAGQTGLDMGYITGLGFIPGVNMNTNFWTDITENFWVTIGGLIGGPTPSDAANLYKDIKTGHIDLTNKMFWQDLLVEPRSKAWRDLASSRSFTGINVGIQQTARAFKEMEDRYIEYTRGRPGIPLTVRDVVARGFSLTTSRLQREKQVFANTRKEAQKANDDKVQLEDRMLKLDDLAAGTEDPKRLKLLGEEYDKLYDQIEAFNVENWERTGVMINNDTLKEADKNRYLTLEERTARSQLQLYLIQERLQQVRGGTELGQR